MSTTHHTALTTSEANRENPVGTSKATGIDALKRRKRLGQLLSTRRHLAAMAAQQRSHGIEDAEESFNLQLVVESTIRDEFPDQYEEEFATWLERDVSGEHPSGVLTAGCGICRSVARARGVNLETPEAA